MKMILLLLTAASLLFGAYSRNSANNTVYDDQTNLTWQDDANVSDPAQTKTWDEAIDYCANLVFAGQSDWRLPNFNELYMIADRSTDAPAMHMDAANGFQNLASYVYWSSTTGASGTSSAWYVYFDNGIGGWVHKTYSFYVRCVRSGEIIANLAPTDLNLSSATITENSGVGTTIGELNATDPDANDTHTYNLTCSDANQTGQEGNFTIEGTTLKSAVAFDYETQTSYSICVKVTDNGGLSYEKNVTVTITNDASDDPAPEINVKGNGVSIPSGDTTPSVSDHSDFGSVNIASGSVVRTFSIENNGTAVLNLTGTPPVTLSGSAAFSLTQQPSTAISAPGSTTFSITFDPSTVGTHSATVSIANSDSDENPYTFDINGSGYEVVASSSSSSSSSSIASSSSSVVSSSSSLSSASSSSAPSGDNDDLDEDPAADGNHDNTPDAQQNDVGYMPSVTVESTGKTLSGLSTAPSAQSVTLSDGGSITLPYGTVSFTVSGLTVGGTAQISLYYPYDTTIAGYAKNVNGTWYDMGASVEHNQSANYTKVSFSITDGSMFDLDGSANGSVQDPGGAYRAGSASVSVPLFSLPGFALLALLLGLSGFGFARRRVL